MLSIGFAKAFDSIDRFQEYKIHPKIINIIADTYSHDKISIFLDKNKITDFEITSGIRQGCNILALLFVIVTPKIVESIHKFGFG